MAQVLTLPLPTPLVDVTNCFPRGLDMASESFPAQRAKKAELTLEVKPISTPIVVLSVRVSSVLLHLPLILNLAHSYPV